ncbi:putative polysaccharide biosynthesis protein with aminopeptidase-like domain [Cytophagales bacterium WSM2-2]|nr:putative polysaccharide biosynthesis protein with aminopeptidase-like domain [Cytophagales bacterium WSM2-2]
MEAITKPVKKTFTLGGQMHSLMTELFPICRSITGDGIDRTLEIIKKNIPIIVHKVPTGTKVFDWEVPKEWNIKEAYVKNSRGEKIIDFTSSNLHVLNYSVPIDKSVTLEVLKEHLHTLPEHPDWIPYRTSYYKEDWGFCLAHNQFQNLTEDVYDVYIDSSLREGHLTYAEYYIPGELPDEVLVSTRICHPSMCNDNLSGICVATFLAKELAQKKLRYSYRFLFVPGTIGAITWLSVNEAKVKQIKHGLIVSLLGDSGKFTYKKSRQGDAEIDQIIEEALKMSGNYNILKFSPYGDDERQFCSPGFNLPVGSLMKTPFGEYPEYHTSADNLEFVKPEALDSSLQMLRIIVNMIEANHKYVNINPKCELQLGKRGLYNMLGGEWAGRDFQLALLWVLNFSDGMHSLLDICKESGIDFRSISAATNKLLEHKLLVEA